MNGHSLLPHDLDWFRRFGEQQPEYGNGESVASPFRIRTAHDGAYHVAGIANPILLNRYPKHAPVSAAVEYAGYIRRFRNTVIHTTQVNGGFYCRAGIRMAVNNCRRLLEPESSSLDEPL
ncbi:MAG: hypothetical protein JNL91_11785 [Candidatus Accumulibacter sp.]|nr:hypothetical protein [Accumulibacter sp.]